MRTKEGVSLGQLEGRSMLVTGASGYLGSALVQALAEIPCRLVLLAQEDRPAPVVPGARANVSAVAGDIRKTETWCRVLPGMDYVFHLAAQTSTYVANQDPLTDFDSNVLPVMRLLEMCEGQGLGPGIVFAGTVTQVGIPLEVRVDESLPDHPVTIYDIHKLMAEKYLELYSRETGVQTVTLRLSNVYGPGRTAGSSDRGILNQMVRKGLRGETLTVYGDGRFVRDYVYIGDVVDAFIAAATRMPDVTGSYYVIGSSVGHRIVDAVNLVADSVMKKTGRRPEVAHVPPPAGLSPIEERNFVADTTRFRAATGWEPRVSLADGINRIIDYVHARELPTPATGR